MKLLISTVQAGGLMGLLINTTDCATFLSDAEI